jgi:hypothetical protein
MLYNDRCKSLKLVSEATMNSRRPLVATLGFALLLTACGGGGVQSDGRVAAVQAALDANPSFIFVPNGKSCHHDIYWGNIAPKNFKGLKYVTVKASGEDRTFMGTEPCTTVTWDKSAKIMPTIGNDERAELPIGHYVVEKVGDEQDGPMGAKVTPYKAHFEWSSIGKDMQARHLAQEPAPRPDAMAEMHKDADGKWIAQLVS